MIALPIIAFFAWLVEPEVSYQNISDAFVFVFLIGFFILGLSKIFWMEALYRISITKISAMIALVPMLTLLFAYLYLGEVPEFRQVFGIIPVLVGRYLLTNPMKEV